jgi:DNA gyrase subunit A
MTDITPPTGPLTPRADIAPITIEEEMKRSYLDYAMSVIVSRALPDVRDGLKPVHRRILFGMKEGGYASDKAPRKSANIVGEVMGRFHPHGDSAIYDAMVRMVQDFSMRLPLVHGQGNYGSMDGDPPAAMRYTEARLGKAGDALLADIDKETVSFQPNYDETREEPTVLPARFPNLLVNGAGGIAVGMATNIPTHNLGEVIDVCCAYLDNRDLTMSEIMEIMPGPDFPTGGLILGRAGIRQAFETGPGSIMMRARTVIEENRDRMRIVVTEIPYQVNKKTLVQRIAEVVNEKIVEGVSDVRDTSSNRGGLRIEIDLKRDAVPDVVLAQLFKNTPLQTSFGVNMMALIGGRPRMLNVKEVIVAFIDFREEVITRRTIFDLNQARTRAHTLIGLGVAVANIDAVIELIRKAPDPGTAKAQLTAREWEAGDVAPLIALIDEPGSKVSAKGTYQLSEEQAKAILDLRLHRLTGLERDKILGDLQKVSDEIKELLSILADRDKLFAILRNELIEVKAQFADERRTSIDESEFEADMEDLIQREDMVVTVSMTGYVKRVPLSTYRAQRRGGKGRTGMATKDEDSVADLFIANTHTPMLFFTTAGMVYKLKVYRLPIGSPTSKGKALINLLPLDQGETVSAVMPLPEDETTWDNLNVMFATSHGSVRRNKLSDFTNIRANGLIAMKLEDGEGLIAVKTCAPDQDVLLSTSLGKCIRFSVGDVRVFSGRTSTGVRGIKLGRGDNVIGLSILNHVEANSAERQDYLKRANALRRASGEEVADEEIVAPDVEEDEAGDGTSLTPERFEELATAEEFILTVTDTGFGKRTSSHEYRLTGRGGQGISNMELSSRNSRVIASFPIDDHHEVMLATDGGQVLRMKLNEVRIAGRRTQGVTLFRVAADEKVVSAASILLEEDEDEEGQVEVGHEMTIPPDTTIN